jgi:hypothetical protein
VRGDRKLGRSEGYNISTTQTLTTKRAKSTNEQNEKRSNIYLSSRAEFFHSLVRVTSIEVKRYYIFPPGALSILSVLVLESEETPNGPPK